MNNKISWAVPTLACALIFTFIFGFSMLIGVIDFSLMGLCLDFLVGSMIGFLAWAIFL